MRRAGPPITLGRWLIEGPAGHSRGGRYELSYHQPAPRRWGRAYGGLCSGRRSELALRRGRRRAAHSSASRLPGVLVRMAATDRAARGGWFSGGRPRHSWLQPLVEAGGLQGLRRRPACRRHPRSHRRTRRQVRSAGRARLGRKHRLDRRDESPRGGRPTRHPQRRPSPAAPEGLRHPSQLRKSWYFFFFATPGLPEEVVHARDWHFFRHFLQDANPPTRKRRWNVTSRPGRSQEQPPG